MLLNYVHILNPEALAGTQHCTGILRLINVLKQNSDIPGSFTQNPLKNIQSAFGYKPRQVINQIGSFSIHIQK
jgi:hypothetical protein